MTDPEKPAPENIAQALAAVMQEVGYVQKKKQGGVSYTFASESDFIQAIRPWFLEYGIVIHPAEVSDLRLGEYQTDKGRIMLRTVVIMTYRFTHAPSDTHIDVMVTGEGADIGDKSANKALTGAYKYALRQALLIETGDDPDKSPSEGPEPLKKQYTDGDRDRMGGKFRKRVTKRPEKPAAEKDDLAQRAYWEGLSPEEKGVYRSLTNLVPTLIANSNRYDTEFSARAAILKLFPKLDETGWPGAKTPDDGRLRVVIYRKILAYARLRNAGMDAKLAMAGAEDQIKNG